MVSWPAEFDSLLRRHCRHADADVEITGDTTLSMLGMDSLEIVEFILGIEETFQLTVPEELLTPEVFATTATVWTAIAPLVPAGSGPVPGVPPVPPRGG
jgi:acyl carrier protein